ncbi:hypothetical protein A3709_19895 [Halioglobus sp. HI00S01]|uniref:hypothetical protein n=1 Tax=Halioglobus sp. HI00S01 TaxID=1822214 RepID=UPI0007C25D31|nr:hypothetical protein [Halioglobus sp. HI00S01]KZX57888.1 hypothetical protein A3709_19895 [Halioglobus sp. HI00S01]
MNFHYPKDNSSQSSSESEKAANSPRDQVFDTFFPGHNVTALQDDRCGDRRGPDSTEVIPSWAGFLTPYEGLSVPNTGDED